jgi:hypothetical protein
METKIIILILSVNKDPWLKIENDGIRKTWGNNNNKQVSILYYYGGVNENKLVEDKLFLSSPEGWANIGRKTICAFDYILQNFEFDYIFRTNTSSYVDINLFLEKIKNKSKNNIYEGEKIFYNGIEYASGCGYLISKDVSRLIVKNKDQWDHNLPDDVAISKLLSKFNIFCKTADLWNMNIPEIAKKQIPLDYFHYRCKCDENRNIDIERMHYIHRIKKGEII